MRKLGITLKSASVISVITMLGALGLVSSATAYSGDYARFNYCPVANPEVSKCIFSQITSGVSVIGKAALPIVNPVTLQGGVSREDSEGWSNFVAASNGVTLSRSPQPVPGGLLGILSGGQGGQQINNPLIRRLAESSINRLYATKELARPASAIRMNQLHLVEGGGVMMQMPTKIHLENPLLGKSCYIGSSAAPIMFELTIGTTSPPPPAQPITGSGGEGEFLDEGRILTTRGTTLVDNTWSAPAVKGCGGVLSFLIDPLINRQVGLPSPAGRNAVVLTGPFSMTPAFALKNQ